MTSRGGVGVRADCGGAQEAVFFRRRIFQFFRETYSQNSRYDKCVNPTLGYHQDLRDRDPSSPTRKFGLFCGLWIFVQVLQKHKPPRPKTKDFESAVHSVFK